MAPSQSRRQPRPTLASAFPDLTASWHPQANGDLTPNDFGPNSHRKVWWCCQTCHWEWQATIGSRSKGRGCPACAHTVVRSDRSLGTLFPGIASELHPTLNGTLDPLSLAPYSNRKLWWRCKGGHAWQAAIGNRTRQHSGCPECRYVRRTPELLTSITELRADGLTLSEIGERLGLERHTVSNICRDYKIPTPRYQPPPKARIEEAIAIYTAGRQSISAVARDTGICNKTLAYHLKKAGQQIDDRRLRRYQVDDSSFDRLTPEIFSVLGFIAADGSIKANLRSFKIEVQARDRKHVERIRDTLHAQAPIRHVVRGKRRDGSPKETVSVTIHSVRLVARLIQLGICPRKKYRPMILDPVLKSSPAFWLGFFDGDGHIGFVPSGRPRITLAGQPCVLDQFREFLQTICSCRELPPRRAGTGAGWSQSIERLDDVRRVLKLLYSSSDVSLDRKRDAATKALAHRTYSDRRQIAKCHHCGTEIVRPPSGIRNRTRLYCGRRCHIETQRAERKNPPHNSADWKIRADARRALWRLPSQRGIRAASLPRLVSEVFERLDLLKPIPIRGRTLFVAHLAGKERVVFATAHWACDCNTHRERAIARGLRLIVVHICPAYPRHSWMNQDAHAQSVSTVPTYVFDALHETASGAPLAAKGPEASDG